MKDKELEEILKNNSNGYIGLYDNAWEYNGEYPFPMEEITKALLAWRDEAVREAYKKGGIDTLCDCKAYARQYYFKSVPVNYIDNKLREELQDGK